MSIKTALFGLSTLLLCTAPSHAASTSVPVRLRFAPQESKAILTPDVPAEALAVPVKLVVEDLRQGDRRIVGKGTDDDDTSFAYRTPDALNQFVQAEAREILESWGFGVKPDAKHTLHVTIVRYFVSETNRAVGSMYAAEVRLGSQRQADSVTVRGDATRYGRSRSEDNANEVLSDALKEALASLVTSVYGTTEAVAPNP